MTKPLDVLVLESHPHAAAIAVADLEAAGHRVHRCYGPRDRGFPCVGVADPAACPLDAGIDVALLVRGRVAPRSTPLEGGVSCAIRAGVPLVEDGPDILDPFEPWLAARSDGDVVAACERASGTAFAPLCDDIFSRLEQLLASAGTKPSEIGCRIEADGPRLNVRLDGPDISRRLEQAIGLRVLDAVRAFGRTFGEVNVSYRTPVREPAR